MKVSELIEQLKQKFCLDNRIIFVCGGNTDFEPEIDYKLCDEKNLSNPKKIEAIRRRINEEI